MDSPFSSQFLKEIDPNNQHENWAYLASTDQDGLFFLIRGVKERRFPCFSHFFFSLTLAGRGLNFRPRCPDDGLTAGPGAGGPQRGSWERICGPAHGPRNVEKLVDTDPVLEYIACPC